jgi:hypothetical protein
MQGGKVTKTANRKAQRTNRFPANEQVSKDPQNVATGTLTKNP